MFQGLVDTVTASAWVYPLILGVAALDAVFPLVPSEATVIAAAALAGSGELGLGLVLLAGAAGAVVGDNVAYAIGRAGRGFALDRISRSAAWSRRFARAQAQLRRRGGTVIVVSRFVPGGRTATMISAGIAGLGWRCFVAFDVAAGVVWASYAGAVGWAGGKAAADRPLHALLLAFALAGALALLIEMGRRAHSRFAAAR
ncbi:MAG TPA: VTT domain-containing protein [Gaiellaceae bacterium]|nr:VTT domain-containing protein [Gaiellaceae bacterium]